MWSLFFHSVFWSYDFPADAPPAAGTGHSEGQKTANAAAPQEAGQANLLTITWRDLMADILDPRVAFELPRTESCSAVSILGWGSATSNWWKNSQYLGKNKAKHFIILTLSRFWWQVEFSSGRLLWTDPGSRSLDFLRWLVWLRQRPMWISAVLTKNKQINKIKKVKMQF